MMRSNSKRIAVLPALEPPVQIVAMDLYRDGGSTEVTLQDARQQQLVLWFDTRFGGETRGRLYLNTAEANDQHPIAQNSQAEVQALQWLRDCLQDPPLHINVERLRQLIERVEELRTLAEYGIIHRQ